MLRKNGKVDKPNLYVQFSPSQVPLLKNYGNFLPVKDNSKFLSNDSEVFLSNAFPDDTVILDEVLIETNIEEKRFKMLPENIYGRVDVFDDYDRIIYDDLEAYLINKRINIPRNSQPRIVIATEEEGFKNIQRSKEVTFFLDGVQIVDFNILASFDMTTVDYIIVNGGGAGGRSALGEGFRGANGVVKIFTAPPLKLNNQNKSIYQQITFPLTFKTQQKFYTPKYNDYHSDFFEKYGVVDWKPNLKINDYGNIEFKVFDAGVEELKFFIEGFTDDGKFISEVKTMRVN